jgi:anti-sigma factor RsiW
MLRRLRHRHLGSLAAALVDGEMGPAARDRALGHIAGCERCRYEVSEQRWLKARLHGLAVPPADPALLAALHAVPTSPGPRLRRPALRRDRRRPMRLALAGGGAVVATCGVALLAGGEGDGRAVTPPVDAYVVEHLATTDQMPLTDPDLGAVAVAGPGRIRP